MSKNKSPVRKGIAKVPVVMQLEMLECGAAALSMVLAYYGKWVPLERIRADCGVSGDGTNAGSILKAAMSYGLTAKCYSLEPSVLKERGSFPCIVHWNFNHFVVLKGFRGGKAYINDPANGSYSVSMEVFDSSFTGVCILFEPNEGFEPDGRPKSTLAFIRRRLNGASSAVILSSMISIVTTLLGILRLSFIRFFLDRMLSGRNPEWIMPFFGLLAAVSAAQIIVGFAEAKIRKRIDGKLAVYGSTSYMWKVLRLPMEFFLQRMAGDIQQRKQLNAGISSTLVNIFAPLLWNAVMMVLYLVVMLRYSFILTAVGLISILINLIMSYIISVKRINITRAQVRDEGNLAGTAISGFDMIESIKASGAENGFFERWAGYQASVNTQKVKFNRINQYLGVIPPIISAVCSSVILALGVYLAMSGEFTVGMIMAFQGFLAAFTSPASKLISAGQQLQEMRTEMARVEDVMEYPTDVSCEEKEGCAISTGKLSGRIEMKNVTFGYSRLDSPLIEDFNMTLEPGSRIAFVGASGCGKSTLSKLISGLYQPWSGEILFDGVPMSDIDRSVFTGSIAVVDQDITLFEDTIANNIKMWDSSIEDFEMILAARDAQLHAEIMRREGGYQHRMLEQGRDFSGGQRQRMEIARVLAQDPTIIILDEATSALDAKTEYDVVKAITDRGITCIVVAHRLSTIRGCDEIIVMDHGKVVERGTHRELYGKGGLYTSLVSNE